jgi:hypothetical protein
MPGTAVTKKSLISIAMAIDAAAFGVFLGSGAVAICSGTNKHRTLISRKRQAALLRSAKPVEQMLWTHVMPPAISVTATPAFSVSVTIRPFSCAVQRRRRPVTCESQRWPRLSEQLRGRA